MSLDIRLMVAEMVFAEMVLVDRFLDLCNSPYLGGIYSTSSESESHNESAVPLAIEFRVRCSELLTFYTRSP